MSYDGKLGFGLLADYDAMADLDEMALALERAIADLARAAGATASARPRRARKRAPAAR